MIVLRNRGPIKIGGIYRFDKGTSDEMIIEHILKDFSLKLCKIFDEYYDPSSGCSSLCTYTIFQNRYGLEDPGDVTSDHGEEIYSEIPGDRCARYINEFAARSGRNYDSETVKNSFGRGEFPIVKIYKGYHEGLGEIHVTYSISR